MINSLPNFRFGDYGRSGSGLIVLLQTCRRPVVEAHTEGQTTGSQNVLDFGQGLLAQVRRLEQLYFGALNQVTDVVDVLRLQAGGRTYGPLRVVDRTQKIRVELIYLPDHHRLTVAREVDESRQLVLEDGRGTADGLFRSQCAVGIQTDDQPVQVGTLY